MINDKEKPKSPLADIYLASGAFVSIVSIPANVANPLACPVCGEDADFTSDSRSNNQTIAECNTCGNCKAKWMNFYKMTRQVLLPENSEFPNDIEEE